MRRAITIEIGDNCAAAALAEGGLNRIGNARSESLIIGAPDEPIDQNAHRLWFDLLRIFFGEIENALLTLEHNAEVSLLPEIVPLLAQCVLLVPVHREEHVELLPFVRLLPDSRDDSLRRIL